MGHVTNQTKNSGSWSQASKHTATILRYLRHGHEPTMAEVAPYADTDIAFMNGDTFGDAPAVLEDAVRSLQTKH